jgi:dCMP deaminase
MKKEELAPMIDRKWQGRFLDVAKMVATWSKDPSTKVGAVLVDPATRHILATGYNGFPPGVEDTPARLHDRPTKYAFTVHAEINLLVRAGTASVGAHLFCTHAPCADCAKAIIAAGVACVAFPAHGEISHWAEHHSHAFAMLDEARVKTIRAEVTA